MAYARPLLRSHQYLRFDALDACFDMTTVATVEV